MITHRERVRLFGEFKFAHTPLPGNPEHVTIDRAWARANLVEVDVPQIARIPGRKNGRVTVHKLVVPSLLALWAAWEKEGCLQHIHTFNGAWASRYKRQRGSEAERAEKCRRAGPAALSNHSWGTAFDINAQELTLGKPIPPGHPFQLLLAPVARGLGWEWGGDYTTRPDGMHWEKVRL